MSEPKNLRVGIDVGSTTTKIVVCHESELLFSDYTRHHSNQLKSVERALKLLEDQYSDVSFSVAMTGSGAKALAEELNIPYVQEVVANSMVLKTIYKEIGTAIELGGQDAKIIFFHEDETTHQQKVSDMRMNGSCAGGTGAFIDEIATLLKTPIEEFNDLASKGETVYDISGRCGVYAKTDIQPLLNQGSKKEDIALSSFHAIAKQTIGGLAQGLTIKKPVVFEGGPLTFNPTLIQVFAQRLNLKEDEILCPEHPELLIACGAALASNTLFTDKKVTVKELLTSVEKVKEKRKENYLNVNHEKANPFFKNEEEKQSFLNRHKKETIKERTFEKGTVLKAYLGIDSGSTTTKFVLMDENEELIDSFYASNQGSPLKVAKEALISMREKYQAMGVELDIQALGTTGYGEMLFAHALNADTHSVETVAHARAASKYSPDATFVLDIGGQDMKAIWLDHGIITNIVLNEACSSGCGSFLENFASTLNIPTKQIAQKAFESKQPAELGSRCTVFMNSNIVTEQRNGKLPEDIMAGLCRSIIQNVFTKVIRVSNLDVLGDKIVVQGGTFENDAVLCALEQYVSRPVVRAPYPGIMGAIGAALLAKEEAEHKKEKSQFIGLDALEDLTWKQDANVPCPFCTNHCKRAVLTFSNGNSWITNNRCERGQILGDPKNKQVQSQLKVVNENRKQVANLFDVREKLLFSDYLKDEEIKQKQNITIGLPRVLNFWELMPFWTTFFRKLGFDIKISNAGNHEMFEEGLSAVTSDTICFPAKLVHGHIRDLVRQKVDRIFMPSIAEMAPENTEKTSESMCAVVKGYPIVIRNSDSPEKQWGVPFDSPLFYWNRSEDVEKQLVVYMKDTFDLDEKDVLVAARLGKQAMNTFRSKLKEAGKEVIDQVRKENRYAVILASRPYQNDSLVNHGLAKMICEFGVPVLTADSIPDVEKVDLSKSRIDVVNNFHGRMLGSAIMAAQNEYLEYVQLVSFGCGHDAYLSDEIQRMMHEISGKTPLILKLDESEIQGPLRIRVRSFIETINIQRREYAKKNKKLEFKELSDPYPVKFEKTDYEKTVLIPNTSHAFCQIMSAAISTQGIRTVPLEVGREDAIRLGKKYVHNDICFPAQIAIGEAIAALEKGHYDSKNTAIGMGKYIGDCRLTHYGALLRKALDDAGYEDVAILTNDDVDYHNLHPGFKMNLNSSIRLALALPMIDVLEELLRKIRPYEKVKGSADKAFEKAMDCLVEGLEKKGFARIYKGFKKALACMDEVEYDRSNLRPRVLIVGEYLMNFHPGANHEIERYLEKNGFEIIEARMTDVIRKTYFAKDEQIRTFHLDKGFVQNSWFHIANKIFDFAHDQCDRIAKKHPLYTRASRLPEIAEKSDVIFPHTFDCGEGLLIPGEIMHHADHGCKAFVILQPFGCLPNHIVGRGIVKKLKEYYPNVQILPLDFDPDVSLANLENRLQMLIMNIKEQEKNA